MNDGFNRLRDLLGEHDAFRLMNVCGGTRVYIPTPEHCHAKHYLAQAIGLEKLLLMAKEFGSDRIEIPVGQAALKKMRNDEIIRRLNEGASRQELALCYGLTERQIRTIASRREPVIDKSQLSLFA